MENAKKNLVFHFWGGRHASFPQKPVVKNYVYFQVTLFHSGIEDYATANTSLVSNDVQVIATSTNDQNLFAPCMVGTLESQFLKLQMQVSGAKKVLDIGTFTGKDI